jgi:hypothetical protein
MWPCIVKLGNVIIQLDATMKLIHLNTHHHNTITHGFYFVTVLHTICGSSLLCTPDDGQIDARNVLSWINFIVASSLDYYLPSTIQRYVMYRIITNGIYQVNSPFFCGRYTKNFCKCLSTSREQPISPLFKIQAMPLVGTSRYFKISGTICNQLQN